jgi:hypothetical protein
MSLLVVSNELQLVVEHGSEVCIGEVLFAPFRQSLLVKRILEVLKLLRVSGFQRNDMEHEQSKHIVG